MRRCKKCVMADTRPRIIFDEEGICSPCRHWEYKENIVDWDVRLVSGGAETNRLYFKIVEVQKQDEIVS